MGLLESLLIWLFVRARFVVVPGHDQPEGCRLFALEPFLWKASLQPGDR